MIGFFVRHHWICVRQHRIFNEMDTYHFKYNFMNENLNILEMSLCILKLDKKMHFLRSGCHTEILFARFSVEVCMKVR